MIAEYFNEERYAMVVKDLHTPAYIVTCKESNNAVKEMQFVTINNACDYAEDWVMKW